MNKLPKLFNLVLILIMGYNLNVYAMECPHSSCSPIHNVTPPVPNIPITTPDAVAPPIPTFEIPEDMRKNLEDKLKSTNKQIETIQKGIAKFCPSASDPEQCTAFDESLAELQLEKEDILVGLGDEFTIFNVDADNLVQEYKKLKQKSLDIVKEVSSGKSGNLDVVLAELQERLDELNDRRDNLFDEYLFPHPQKWKAYDQESYVENLLYVLTLHLEGDPYVEKLIDYYAQYID
jgi:hypothetical protein